MSYYYSKVYKTRDMSSENLCSKLLADMLSLYKGGKGPPSDFQLKVELRSFPVHKVVLGARSVVFRAMFDHGMPKKSKGRVLTDIDADTAERMISYIYTDEEPSPALRTESLVDLYAAADKYALPGLREICANRLVQGLAVSNVPLVLKIAHQHEDYLLKKCVVDYIISEGMAAIESEYWIQLEENDPKLSHEVLHQIIKRKKLM